MPTLASSGRSNWRAKALRSAYIAILLGMALISTPRPALGDYPTCAASLQFPIVLSGTSWRALGVRATVL